MYYEIDLLRFLVMIIPILVYFLVLNSYLKKKIHKVYFTFFFLTIFIYSGVGISYKEIGYDNVFSFILFIILSMTSMFIVFKIKFKLNYKDKKDSRETSFFKTRSLIIVVLLFFSVYFIRLMIPDFNLHLIFNPPQNDILNIFQRMNDLRGLLILELFRLLNISTLVFFMIFLQRLKNRKKISWVIILLLLWVYFEFITLGYMSRYELVTYALFILIIFINKNNDEYGVGKKHILLFGLVFVLIMPVLLAFESSRMGISIDNVDFYKSIMTLFFKETDYPKYYSFAEGLHNKSLWSRYFYWILTLPIPSLLAGSLKDNIFILNQFFTEHLTGILYGSQGYSVILPSIYGEALLLYGQYFYWIHAIFIGVFFGLTCKLLEKNNDLKLLNLFFAVKILSIGRGGTTGIIGSIINFLIIYYLVIIILNMINFKKFKLKDIYTL